MTDGLDVAALGLLRSSFESLKRRFQGVADRGEPREAWLMRLANRPDLTLKENFALMNGFDDRRLGVVELGGERWASLPEPLHSVADDAARLVKRLPENIATQLPSECCCSIRNDWPLWVVVVFGLAWSPVPDSLPHADRVIPLNDNQTMLLESVPDFRCGGPFHLTDEQFADVMSKGWYSTLCDFAAASVQAIDVLMSWLDAAPIKPATTPPAALLSNSKPVDDVAETIKRVTLMLGEDGGKIMAIVSHPTFTTDQKLRALGADERFKGYKSDDLAQMLGVSPASIRNSDAWREWNPKPAKRAKLDQK